MTKHANIIKEEWDFLTSEYSTENIFSSVTNDLTKLMITIIITVVIIVTILIIAIIANKYKRK